MRAADPSSSRQLGAGSATLILAILLVMLVGVTAYLLATYYSQNSVLEKREEELAAVQLELRRQADSLEAAEREKRISDDSVRSLRSRIQELQSAGDERFNGLRRRLREYGQQQKEYERELREQQKQLDASSGLAEQLAAAKSRAGELAALEPELDQCNKALAANKEALQACQLAAQSALREEEGKAAASQRCAERLAQADTRHTRDMARMNEELAACRQQLARAAAAEKLASAVARETRQESAAASRQTATPAPSEAAGPEKAALENRVEKLQTELAACRNDLRSVTSTASVEEVAEVKKAYESLIHDLKQEVSDKDVAIERFRDKVKIQIVGKVLFPSGSSHITPKGKEVLQKFFHTLGAVKHKRIYVVGHTDDVDIKAAYLRYVPTNWELSAKRAASVVRYLIDAGGLNPTKLAAVGRSQYDPVKSNATSEGRAQNRRVEIIVSNDLRLQ